MAIRGATPLAPKRSHRLKKTLLSTSLLALITISMMTLFAVNKVYLKCNQKEVQLYRTVSGTQLA